MKLPNLNNWGSGSKIDRLLFFAQVLDEMLFHFTIDSYKPRIYNTHGSLTELSAALTNAKFFQSGKNSINDHIKPIREELSKKISTDLVAKKIIIEVYGDEFLNLVQRELNNWGDLDNYIIFVNSLDDLFFEKYLSEIKFELSNAITEAKDYSYIRFLSDLFVSELLLRGFSQEYLYHSAQSYFFQENQFKDPNLIHEYLDRFYILFPDERREWDVIFKVSKKFEYIPEYTDSQYMSLFKEKIEPRTCNRDERLFLSKIDKNHPYFLLAKNFKASDPYAAKNSVKTLLGFYNDSLKFSTYYLRLKWDEVALVYSEDNTPTITRKSVSPLAKNKKFEKYHPSDLKMRDIDLSEICKNKEKILFEKLDLSGYSLYKALSLHGSAINSENQINQYLNIWIALETLLPRKNGETVAKKICEIYLPILNKKYVNKLIESFQYDLDHCLKCSDSGTIDEFFSDFPKEISTLPSTFLKCSALLSVNDEKYDLIERAKQKIGRNPLLIYRLEELKQKLSKASSIRDTIKTHESRMNWHLLRLYRIRNRLTHQGEDIELLDRLLENINFYFHTVIEEIEEYSEKHSYVDSLSKTFMWIQLEHDAHMKLLSKNKDTCCNYSNFKTLLFGKM